MPDNTPEQPITETLRDGIETLPEPVEPDAANAAFKKKLHDDANLEEALIESFPASDPAASGHFE